MVLIWGCVHLVTALFLHLVETVGTTEQKYILPEGRQQSPCQSRVLTRTLGSPETSLALFLEEKELNPNIH